MQLVLLLPGVRHSTRKWEYFSLPTTECWRPLPLRRSITFGLNGFTRRLCSHSVNLRDFDAWGLLLLLMILLPLYSNKRGECVAGTTERVKSESKYTNTHKSKSSAENGNPLRSGSLLFRPASFCVLNTLT